MKKPEEVEKAVVDVPVNEVVENSQEAQKEDEAPQ